MFGARGGFLGSSAAGGDPYWANVQMLITARSGTLTDATGKATPNLNYDQGTSGTNSTLVTSPVKYNAYSVRTFNSNRWSISSGPSSRNATGVFTMEWWWRSFGTGSSTAFEVPWMISPINVAGGNIIGQIGSTNSSRWSINEVGGSIRNFTTSSAYDQLWHHVCWTRNSSNLISFYYDGVVFGTTVTSTTTFNFSNLMIFGGAGGGDNYSNSYYDDIRLTIGVDRYGGVSFTPPTSAFPIG
jgi:hypothetical protein